LNLIRVTPAKGRELFLPKPLFSPDLPTNRMEEIR